MRNPYKQNAFAILQLPPSATNAEIIEKAEEMEALIEIGEITDITKAQVVQARKKLLLSHSRIEETLFCDSLQAIDMGELQTLLSQWSKNPLLERQYNRANQEEWTEAEIQSDFSPIEEIRTELDTDGNRFDDRDAELLPERFLMELSIRV